VKALENPHGKDARSSRSLRSHSRMALGGIPAQASIDLGGPASVSHGTGLPATAPSNQHVHEVARSIFQACASSAKSSTPSSERSKCSWQS
jgi:hypothetical protein